MLILVLYLNITQMSLSISAKISNFCLIGVGYIQTWRPAVKLTLSALVGGKIVKTTESKNRLALELEA